MYLTRLIPKFLHGGVPAYFKNYGINSKKFISMFEALRTRGLSNQVAFEITWQSLKEVPKEYYSFGSRFRDVNSWVDNVVNHQLKRGIYKNAINAKTFEQYRKATFPYNTEPGYTKWLKEGRDLGKKFINEYIEQNNLGTPVAIQNIPLNDYLSGDNIITAKSGIKIKKRNRGKFTEYCGGKVTLECINKAKNSLSPKLIKRAVFAENARKHFK